MSGPSRRDLLAGTAGALVMSALDRVASGEAADVPSLRALGAARGIEVGSCFSGTEDGIVRALLAKHAAIVTPEWCFKPRFLKRDWKRPTRFAEADRIHAFAAASGMGMHGHTLFWHGDRVDWADGLSQRDAELRYGAFLDEVMRRYADLPSWDVVNEPIADPEPGLLRSEPLLDKFGLDFIVFLFQRARLLAPGATLVLNDYNLECGKPWCTAKQDKAIDLVDQLLARGAPIDAVGLQGHLASRNGVGIETTLAFCDKLAARGLDVHITELDVNDATFADDIAQRDRQVAGLYGAYLSAMLQHRAVKRVVFWGLTDRDHVLVRESRKNARPAGEGRPGLFDAEGRPKAAFHAVAAALSAAPAR